MNLSYHIYIYIYILSFLLDVYVKTYVKCRTDLNFVSVLKSLISLSIVLYVFKTKYKLTYTHAFYLVYFNQLIRFFDLTKMYVYGILVWYI